MMCLLAGCAHPGVLRDDSRSFTGNRASRQEETRAGRSRRRQQRPDSIRLACIAVEAEQRSSLLRSPRDLWPRRYHHVCDRPGLRAGQSAGGCQPEHAVRTHATVSDFRLTPASIWRTDKPFRHKRCRGSGGDVSTCAWALDVPTAVQGSKAGCSACRADIPVGEDRL
jgi:hypothetical protein